MHFVKGLSGNAFRTPPASLLLSVCEQCGTLAAMPVLC